MKIGKRSPREFLLRVADPNNYAALMRVFAVHRHPVRVLFQEVFSLGTYPRSVVLRTPCGPAAARLHSPADMSTLNLVFCRGDYLMPPDARVVVDIGSNIGLSALFWLTRRPGVVVHCHEPSPLSFARLEENLAAFAGRVTLNPTAVSDFSGVTRLGLEPSGVYSSLDLVSEHSVECRVVHVNEALEAALSAHGAIDVLKIDSEGHEIRTLKAIDPGYWKHIRCVNVDTPEAASVIPGDFTRSHRSSAERFLRDARTG